MASTASQLLSQLFRCFWTTIAWLFSRKERAPDLEERIGLPAKIPYGNQGSWPNLLSIPDIMTATTSPNISQPPRHLEKRPGRKRQFFQPPNWRAGNRSGSRGRTYPNTSHTRSSSTSEPPRRSPVRCSKDTDAPPIILVEDWSSSRFPKVSPGSSGSSLAMPVVASPRIDSASAFEIGSHFPRGSLAGSTRARIPSRGRRPERINETHSGDASILNFPLTDISNQVKNKANQNHAAPPKITELENPPSGTILHNAASPRRPSSHRKPRDKRQINSRREWVSNKINSTPKGYHSHPFSAATVFPLWDEINMVQGWDGELRWLEGENNIRNSFGIIVPYVVAQPGLRSATTVEFHEMQDFIDDSNDQVSSFQHPWAAITTPPATILTHFSAQSDFHLGDIPYPYVFDLSDYYQDPLPVRASIVPSCIFPTSISTWNGESLDASNLPTSAPKKASASLTIASPHRLGLTSVGCDGIHGLTDARLLVYEYPSPPSEFDEEFRARQESFVIFGGESGYSLTNGASTGWGGRNLGYLNTDGRVPGEEGVTTGTTSETPILPGVLSGLFQTDGSTGHANISSGDKDNERNISCIRNEGSTEMNQICTRFRSLATRTCDLHSTDTEDRYYGENQVSFVEEHNSGSALVHYRSHRHWRFNGQGSNSSGRMGESLRARCRGEDRMDDLYLLTGSSANVAFEFGIGEASDSGGISGVSKAFPSRCATPVCNHGTSPGLGIKFDLRNAADCYRGFTFARSPYFTVSPRTCSSP